MQDYFVMAFCGESGTSAEQAAGKQKGIPTQTDKKESTSQQLNNLG